MKGKVIKKINDPRMVLIIMHSFKDNRIWSVTELQMTVTELRVRKFPTKIKYQSLLTSHNISQMTNYTFSSHMQTNSPEGKHFSHDQSIVHSHCQSITDFMKQMYILSRVGEFGICIVHFNLPGNLYAHTKISGTVTYFPGDLGQNVFSQTCH